jgi:hypothetical protein
MVKNGIIQLLDIVFIYSQPVEEAMIGIVESINYPFVVLRTLKRNNKNRVNSIEKIDISKDIPLTILDKNKLNNCFEKEKKKLEKLKKDFEIIDLFGEEF